MRGARAPRDLRRRGNGRVRRRSAPWAGTAFLVEACLLLAFVAGCVAVLTALFVGAGRQGAQAEQLTAAVELARDAAERFAAGADADAAENVAGPAYGADGLVVTVEAREDDEAAGLVRATIVVTDAAGGEVYRLETARFDGSAGGSGAGATGVAAAGGAAGFTDGAGAEGDAS